MMPSPHTIAWLELVVVGIVVSLLVLLVVGLLLMRPMRWRSSGRPAVSLWGRVEARLHGARAFVEVDQLGPDQILTIQAVLQRGWTPEMMDQVLGRPDYAVLDPQRRQEPLRVYDRARVERAEQGKRFRSFQAEQAAKNARSEARLRKWIELRGVESDGPSGAS